MLQSTQSPWMHYLNDYEFVLVLVPVCLERQIYTVYTEDYEALWLILVCKARLWIHRQGEEVHL